jgi:hypothetical protein
MATVEIEVDEPISMYCFFDVELVVPYFLAGAARCWQEFNL